MRTDELPTSEKTRETAEQCLKTWATRLDLQPSEDFDWIGPRIESILSTIQSTVPHAPTRKTHLGTLSSLLNALGIKSPETTAALNKAIADCPSGDNKAPDGYLPLDCLRVLLTKMRADLPTARVKTHQEATAVLCYTMLACYTLQPPLRRDWGDIQLIENLETPSAARGTLHLPTSRLHLIHDKVVGSKGPAFLTITQPLKDAILASLALFPRKYVLSSVGDPNRPLGTNNTFSLMLSRIHNGRSTNINCYRKAWAATLHGAPDNKWHDLAKQMRTSAEKLRSVYFVADPPKPEPELLAVNPDGSKTVRVQEPQAWAEAHLAEQASIDDSKFKAYRWEVNRKALLRQYNDSKRHPNPKTMAKYGVTFDGTSYQLTTRQV